MTCLMGPCTALPLLLSPSPHSAMWATFQVSSHTAGAFHFFHRVLADYGLLQLLLPGP
ncbi:unnamed protein product [Staurois parvus]|uniref:Secreted protein n=1 Tax=Staurois parvus TaxID=386267 RepID=A0ABN9D1K4_9NEOB|nr:unnamed protein product [Staurois parvus]